MKYFYHIGTTPIMKASLPWKISIYNLYENVHRVNNGVPLSTTSNEKTFLQDFLAILARKSETKYKFKLHHCTYTNLLLLMINISQWTRKQQFLL